MTLITLDVLTKAIQRKLEISRDEARKYAGIVLDHFGYDDSIIDNNLDHYERRLFYRLQAEGLLLTSREDTILSDGKCWRIHYWILQKNEMFPIKSEHKEKIIPKKNKEDSEHPSQTIYSSLPDTAWVTRKTTPL
jgi:hypothetical protein